MKDKKKGGKVTVPDGTLPVLAETHPINDKDLLYGLKRRGQIEMV